MSAYDIPSKVEVAGHSVRIFGPGDVDYQLTAAAAFETASRINEAAIDLLMAQPVPIRLARPPER